MELHGGWDGDVVSVETDAATVTVLGCCLAGRVELGHAVASAARTGRYGQLARLAGSCHALVRTPEQVVVVGDAFGVRQLFYVRHTEGWLVSDRADVLARSVSDSLDDDWLSLWLAWPPPGIALGHSPWRHVRAVPAGSLLSWRPGATVAVQRWWEPPTPDRSLVDGAQAVADALAAGVVGRVRGCRAPSCDLSGGKDSTAVAFLAARATEGSQRLRAVTLPSVSADNDDRQWAHSAVDKLGEAVEHLDLTASQVPLPFSDLDPLEVDHPSVMAMHSARHRRLAQAVTAAGCNQHLTGHGGDDVVEAAPAYIGGLLRRRPSAGISRLRQWTALAGQPFWPALRASTRSVSYSDWLRRTAVGLTRPRRPAQASSGLGWGPDVVAPTWLTADARASAAQLLEAEADGAGPASDDVGEHATLAQIVATGGAVRLYMQFMEHQGLRAHAPYLDTAMVEACLAVRADERTRPDRYKPLLDTAMAQIVPTELSERTTKGHYSEDTALGLRQHRQRVAEMLTDGHLVRRGLIEASTVTAACMTPRLRATQVMAVADTLSCERWLRSIEGAP